jgi:hypothetical protein
MKSMGNILLTLALLTCLACDDVKEYPWNDSWNGTEQEAPEDSEDTQTPEDSETPETPSDPEVPSDPQEPSEPEMPADPEAPEEPESPEDPSEPETPELEEPEPPEVQTPEGWMDVTSQFGDLPSYLRILKASSTLEGKKAVAYVAEADMTQAEWDVWSVKIQENGGNLTEETDDSFKTPSQVYSANPSPIIINGGYFYYSGSKRYTSSLAVSNSVALAYNIGYEFDGNGKTRYPVRAVFRESSEGGFDACWTYTIWNRTTWIYPSPSDDLTKLPSAAFPAGAIDFEAKTAIGGGPLLINEGEFVNSIDEEMFSGISPDSNQPRTAIGVTADNKIIFFVCEGREMTPGVNGLTTADVANVLLDLGCVEAINLDGGGSSCMLVNGKETIKVSDGSQRAVASTVMLK